MLEIDVRLSFEIYDALAHAATRATDPAALRTAVSETVLGQPAFGSEAEHIAHSPAEWFDLPRMADREFWAGQDVLCEAISGQLTDTVETIVPFLPPVPDNRVIPVVVHPIPGMITCFGAPDGGQLFGLYHHADPRELLLFLSHTYYHELSGTLSTAAARRAEADPSTADRFQRWLLLLIRHEGIANYAVLNPLRRLRDEQIDFRYFKYAALVDNVDAAARAMSACRQLLGMLDEETVERVSRRVSAVLKNPRLPVINLIGIHLAEAIARAHGERVLLDVDQREPEEFFRLYAQTDDLLRAELFGPEVGAATSRAWWR